MFVTPAQMHEHETAWFAGAGDAATALAEAGDGIARIIASRFPRPGTLWLFLGHGHNAGDAIVAATHLARRGWLVRHHFANPSAPLAPLAATHFANLSPLSAAFDPATPPHAAMPRPWLALDGLVGIGARLPLTRDLATTATAINSWRASHGSQTIAIDIPSGLDGSTGEATLPCVTADLTITIAAVKRGTVLNDTQVGRLALLPLKSLPPPASGSSSPDEILLTSDTVARWLPPRPHDLHKGSAGRIAIIAGSPGMTGAAALAALGALHGGAGLVHIFTHAASLAETAARCPPESMVKALPASGLAGFPAAEFDAVAIGPGCGRTLDASLPSFVRHCPCPLVIDADALNGLARQCGPAALPLAHPPAPRLLTPHPGEFARLAPDLAKLPRAEAAAAMANRHTGTTILLKGPRTIVARSCRPLAYNPTGHHGLATGGAGDVLTGLAAALLARQPEAWKAACAAAWLHGRASELALYHGNESAESLIASTLARSLGPAFHSLRDREA